MACGPGTGSSGDATAGVTSTGDTATGVTSTGDPSTVTGTSGEAPTTGAATTPDTAAATTTTGAATTGPDTTGDTTGAPPDVIGGPCIDDWELPAASVASLHINVPDATVATAFEPTALYPDETPAACVRWDGDKLAGVRLAFGPVVGEGPESLLEVVVSDGERVYGTSQWPPLPGAYDGVSVRYSFHPEPGVARIFDFVVDEGVGEIDAKWVPRATGEHIWLDAKLSIPNDSPSASVGFTIDAVIAPAAAPDLEFCGTLGDAFKCDLAGCGQWVTAVTVDDLAVCSFAPAGFCAAEVVSTGDPQYDSTFFAAIDGEVRLVRVGGEGCNFAGDEHPAGWSECTGAPGEPPECDCVCAGGVCPGDLALALLEACDLPEPCPDAWSEGDGWPGEDCFYQAAAAQKPGVLRVHSNWGDPDFDDRVYLRGGNAATWLEGECDVSCIDSCADRDWGLAWSCTLREPAFFTNCAASVDPDVLAECHDFQQWFTTCTVAPATCP